MTCTRVLIALSLYGLLSLWVCPASAQHTDEMAEVLQTQAAHADMAHKLIKDSAAVLQDMSTMLKNFVLHNASADVETVGQEISEQHDRRALKLQTRCADCGHNSSEPVVRLSRALLAMKDDIASISSGRPHHAGFFADKMRARMQKRAKNAVRKQDVGMPLQSDKRKLQTLLLRRREFTAEKKREDA